MTHICSTEGRWVNSLRTSDTYICVSKLNIIGSDNGLSPDRRQAIIWTNAGTLLIGPLGTNFSEILIEIIIFSFKKIRLKVPSAKQRPFCLGLNVLRQYNDKPHEFVEHSLIGNSCQSMIFHNHTYCSECILNQTDDVIPIKRDNSDQFGWFIADLWYVRYRHHYPRMSNKMKANLVNRPQLGQPWSTNWSCHQYN